MRPINTAGKIQPAAASRVRGGCMTFSRGRWQSSVAAAAQLDFDFLFTSTPPAPTPPLFLTHTTPKLRHRFLGCNFHTFHFLLHFHPPRASCFPFTDLAPSPSRTALKGKFIFFPQSDSFSRKPRRVPAQAERPPVRLALIDYC